MRCRDMRTRVNNIIKLTVGSHDNFRRSPRYKILYQATGVSTGKISPPLHGNFASFGCFGEYVCEVTCPPLFFFF